MTVSVGAREARASFFDLLERAARGETITITRRGEAVARIVPPERPPRRQGGWYKGELWIAPDFDQTPQEVVDLFEGGEDPGR